MTPTKEQQDIIDNDGSCVVIAKPGSGKTFTLSMKIAKILTTLPSHKGVIAISYTNKASRELRDRTLKITSDTKATFFGTIDKFCLTELVIPFLRHQNGLPRREVRVVKIQESLLDEEQKKYVANLLNSAWTKEGLIFVRERFLEGEVYLDLAGKLASHFLKTNQTACNYIRARYSHIIVDEYQDSGFEQHEIFLKLLTLGLKAVAVGDLDQSIYGFANKSAEYLHSLTTKSEFQSYSLTLNHRCHASIAAYAAKFLDPNVGVFPTDEIRVYLKTVDGGEANIAKWIDSCIPRLKERFEIEDARGIGILVRSNRTAQIVHQNLKIHPSQIIEETPLDYLQTPWSSFFSDTLRQIFDKSASLHQLFEDFLDDERLKHRARTALKKLIINKRAFHNGKGKLEVLVDAVSEAAKSMMPNFFDANAVHALMQVTSDPQLLQNYYPMDKNKVQIMTIHKSKGLEFEAVFHLDMYQFIIPSYLAIKGDKKELAQSVNLHYVGITRAKKTLILCSSSERTNDKGITRAELSEFILGRPALVNLRKQL